MQAAPCVSSIPRNSTLSLEYVVKRCIARRAGCRLLQYVITMLEIYQRGLLDEVQLVDHREHCMATWQYVYVLLRS